MFLHSSGLTVKMLPSPPDNGTTGRGASGVALVIVGTYTEKRTEGVFAFRLDRTTGSLTPLGSANAGPNPTWLTAHTTEPIIYAVNETGGEAKPSSGAIAALGIRSDGTLNRLPWPALSTCGSFPCHSSLHPSGQWQLVANYSEGEGSVCVLALSPAGQPTEQTAFVRLGQPGVRSSAHCFFFAPGGEFALATDLRQNCICVFHFDAEAGTLTPHSVPFAALPGPSETLPRGAGPRHALFSPDGRFLYCVTEYASTVIAFAWDGMAGTLSELETHSLLPPDYKGKHAAAAVRLSPDGQFLYASNRGHDSIALFARDTASGRLIFQKHFPTGGGHPRDFAFDPTGAFVLAVNRDGNNLVVFRVNRETGELAPTNHEAFVTKPVCVLTLSEIAA